MKKIVAVGAVAAGVLALSACGDWTSSTYPSGEIIELSRHDQWVETDCYTDGAGEIESCSGTLIEDCFLVRFVTKSGVELSDCTDESAWKALDIGADYTDE